MDYTDEFEVTESQFDMVTNKFELTRSKLEAVTTSIFDLRYHEVKVTTTFPHLKFWCLYITQWFLDLARKQGWWEDEATATGIYYCQQVPNSDKMQNGSNFVLIMLATYQFQTTYNAATNIDKFPVFWSESASYPMSNHHKVY